VSLGKERESRSRVLKEDIAKGVRNGENNSGGKIAQEGKREDRGNLMKPRCRGHIHDKWLPQGNELNLRNVIYIVIIILLNRRINILPV